MCQKYMGRNFPGYFCPFAPRVGSDVAAFRRRLAWAVSIHAPRVGSDPNLRFDKSRHVLFQSTLLVWGATSSFAVMPKLPGSFNPRSPCGERLHPSRIMPLSICFNPRSPCGERQHVLGPMSIPLMFQSTLPVWGATAKMHKILFLISEEYVDSAKRQAVGLNIKGNLPFIPSAF